MIVEVGGCVCWLCNDELCICRRNFSEMPVSVFFANIEMGAVVFVV